MVISWPRGEYAEGWLYSVFAAVLNIFVAFKETSSNAPQYMSLLQKGMSDWIPRQPVISGETGKKI